MTHSASIAQIFFNNRNSEDANNLSGYFLMLFLSNWTSDPVFTPFLLSPLFSQLSLLSWCFQTTFYTSYTNRFIVGQLVQSCRAQEQFHNQWLASANPNVSQQVLISPGQKIRNSQLSQSWSFRSPLKTLVHPWRWVKGQRMSTVYILNTQLNRELLSREVSPDS